MTGGGSSIPPVQRLLAVLATGRRCAEAGTAFGEGAAAMAGTAASLVGPLGVELLAPGGLLVADDMTPGGPGPDPVRQFLFEHPELVAVEILTAPETAALVAAKRA